MSEPLNFRSRFAVRVTDEDGREVQITPVESVNINMNTPSTSINSTEDYNLGYSDGPPAYGFDMVVYSTGDSPLELAKLQLQRKEFDVITQVSNDLDDWSFAEDGITLLRCKILNSNPAVQIGVQAIRFGCAALGVEIAGEAY